MGKKEGEMRVWGDEDGEKRKGDKDGKKEGEMMMGINEDGEMRMGKKKEGR